MKTEKKELSFDWKKFGSIDLNGLRQEIQKNNSLFNEFGFDIAFCSIEEEFVCIDHFIISFKH